jgi:hypothetical protein
MVFNEYVLMIELLEYFKIFNPFSLSLTELYAGMSLEAGCRPKMPAYLPLPDWLPFSFSFFLIPFLKNFLDTN